MSTIRMSRASDRFSTYSRSTASRSSNVSSPRPKTCIGPVIPGLTCKPELVLRQVALDEVELLRPRADDGHLARGR